MPALSSPAPVRLVLESGETQTEVDAFIAKATAIRASLEGARVIDSPRREHSLLGAFSLIRLSLPDEPLMRLDVKRVQLDPSADAYSANYANIISPAGIISEMIVHEQPDLFDPDDPLPWLFRRLDLWLDAAANPIMKHNLHDWPWVTPDPAYRELVHAINVMRIADGLPPPERDYHYTGVPYFRGYLNTKAHWSETPSLLSDKAADFIASKLFGCIAMKTYNGGEHRLSPANLWIANRSNISSLEVMKTLASWPPFDGPFLIPQPAQGQAA